MNAPAFLFADLIALPRPRPTRHMPGRLPTCVRRPLTRLSKNVRTGLVQVWNVGCPILESRDVCQKEK